MPDDLTSRVIAVIAKNQKIPAETIGPEATFDELKIDSLDGIQILFALEQEFDIGIPDEEAKAIRGIPGMVDGIRKLIEAKGAA